ncbi:MAG: TPM domain-containing protein [Victivallales bacterium]|jgi:uncharacterized membrane protein|nr:TPM domain-containing protein [Victivallales bacterium]MBT7164976.1 TPM domain-containing protein [Victivallales bacterium]MBT7304050.1 TPM domain-containing protein [Victivallales bacterium]
MAVAPKSKEFRERIVAAITAAEKDTSGEIRLHIQNRVKGDILEVAKKRFEKMGMTATELRNGVLFFMAMKDQTFSVLGDKGIDDLVPDDFWEETVGVMREQFGEGDLLGGLEAGIRKAGQALKEFFPYQSDDVNELSDEISYGEE